MIDKGPEFFVVGAPKSATSSLWAYLGQHPDIFVPDAPKESHFFSYPEVSQAYYRRSYVTTPEEYQAVYAPRTTEKLAGDFSPSYLFYPEAARRIKEYRPDARVIMVLRNPVKRAISHYLMDLRMGLQKNSLSEVLKDPETHGSFYREYVSVGLYTPQVRTYLDTFGPDQVSILLYEDFLKDKQGFVTGILQFIGADASHHLDLETAHNAYRMPRSRLVEKFRQSGFWLGVRKYVPAFLKNSAKPLMDNTKKPDLSGDEPVLRELFREDVGQLSTLLKRDLSFWLD